MMCNVYDLFMMLFGSTIQQTRKKKRHESLTVVGCDMALALALLFTI
jgi:hypothetical protein